MNFSELENLVYETIQQNGRMLLEATLASHSLAQVNEEGYPCSNCGRKLRIQESAQQRVLKTRFGEITYRRPYGVCDGCGGTAVPMDQAIGIPQSGPSVGTRERVCHAAVVGRSFEDGREILNVHSGIVFSGKHVRTLAEQDGACVAAELEKDVKDFQAGSLEFPAAEKVELIVVTCDGGRIQTRQLEGDSRWKEDKIGAVYDAIAQPNAAVCEENYEGAKALSKTYVATMKPWESFGWMLRVEAEKRGYLKAREKLFVADGARSIGEMRRLQFPDAIFILDWAHAAGHLAQCAQAIFGPDPKA